MFRALNIRKQLHVSILGKDSLDIKELADLVAAEILVCEHCKELLQMVRGHKGIWYFKHYPSVLETPPCIFRGKNLRYLMRIQVRLACHETHEKEINLIEENEYFRIGDETRSYLAALKRNEALHKRKTKPIPGDLFCHCELCDETRSDWAVIDSDTRVGKCRDCLRLEHKEKIWIEQQLTKNPNKE